jgi:hypothetical protein
MTTIPDAYFHVDELKQQCEAISDSRAEWLENAAIKIQAKYKDQLRLNDHIPDYDYDHLDIMALCTSKDIQLPYDKVIYDLAYKQAEKDLDRVEWDTPRNAPHGRR